MGQTCEDPTQYYDELVKECVDRDEDDVDNHGGERAKADDTSDGQDETPSASLKPLAPPINMPITMASPIMAPPLVNASSTEPSPSVRVLHASPPCGVPHGITVPKGIPQLTVFPRETPHTTVSPAPAEFPFVAVVVSFSVATVLWTVVLGVLLCRRRLLSKTGQKRSGQDLADELEKGDLAARINDIGYQVGCRDITVPPSFSMAIQCSGSSDMGANHAFPLPAMDLGAALLVTTKTGQCAVDTTLQDGLR